ncbi:eukaryotic translation initiation factor SUI1 family protein [Boletus edulis BED1]|uniref:Eukaryotic translation initiation factor SUI1 family protein n=1 Tax=Boletus edulis BED1 TaxID=1328754 RepID=A0AAD4GEM7_BOLED|nr:eukaryotic translation initiation factor SUI1 family protein [Boletus edulis BED1]
MFKKPLSSTKTSAPLRSSDRRKLKQRVVQVYGISPELGDLLVPEGLMSQKVATYTNDPGVVYLSSEGDPLWFTVGKGADDLIPTVYTLWKKFDLLPWVSTPAAVIPVLVGGADLMIPGVVQVSSPTVLPQQLVSIVQRTVGSTLTRGPPLAVGRLAVDLNTLKEGAKGKAVHVLHTWKDHLFDMGSKADPPGEMEIKEDELESVPDVVATDPGGTNGAASNALPSDELQAPASAPKIQTSTPSEPAFSKEEVSDMLRVAVLQAIETTLASLTSASFPIPASTFYSSYILPFRPAVVHKSSSDEQSPPSSYPQIDIKHSSYKSLIAFLKFLDKQRILSLKDMKPEPLVMSVSATHPDVIAHRPYTSLRDVQIKEEKRERREEEARSKVREMEVKELWKPHAASGSARFFTEGGFDSSALYSYSDLKLAVNEYVDARQLTNPRDRSYVNVGTDEVLLSTACAKGEAPENVEFLKRDDVVRRLSEKMQRWYEIQAEGKDPVLKKGQLKPISVVVKVRQGRKANTLVVGFEPFFLEGEEMADELRRICACATSVSPAPGRASGLEVLVQGKQIKAVTEFLLSRGVPKKWIESLAGKK